VEASGIIDAGLVLLRPWAPADVEVMGAAVAESVEHLRPWMAWVQAEPLSTEERLGVIERFAEGHRTGTDLTYGMFVGDEMVGGCGLHTRIGPGTLEVGYWVHPRWTGQGIATAAAAALTDTALTRPGIERVEIHHDRVNHRSGRVPARLGYRLVAEVRRPLQAPGESGVEHQWRTTAAEWPGRPHAR
jgi:ribosomal-protein-serine acetyltransferase